jgi:hypothetical protein
MMQCAGCGIDLGNEEDTKVFVSSMGTHPMDGETPIYVVVCKPTCDGEG